MHLPFIHPNKTSLVFVFQLELKNTIIKIKKKFEKNQTQQQKKNERISNITTLHKPHLVKADTNKTK
jgi:hypothetical protein